MIKYPLLFLSGGLLLKLSRGLIMDNSENAELNKEQCEQSEPTLRGYKLVCLKLGLSMCVYFLCRLFGAWAGPKLSGISSFLGDTAYEIVSSTMLILLVYVIPLVFSALIFGSFEKYKGKYKDLYKIPDKTARAMGTFPATFGLGHGVALLTLLALFLISRNLSGHSYLDELLRPTTAPTSTSAVSIVILVFMLVVIAPLFEEFWVRGIMFDALKPYGSGIAIIISSLLFGLMHGSLYMLFYTTAYGFALGYIRYATNSLFIVTILHAIVNSIGAIALVLTSLSEITGGDNRTINTLLAIYLVALVVMIIVGVVAFLFKIPSMRRYKIENGWTQYGPWKKTALFFISIPVIIMMVLAFNEISQGLLIRLFY